MAELVRGSFRFVRQPDALTVEPIDYDALPAHLSPDDLGALGLAEAADDPAAGLARALAFGAYQLSSTPEGVHVTVSDYHADPLLVPLSGLAALGLVPTGGSAAPPLEPESQPPDPIEEERRRVASAYLTLVLRAWDDAAALHHGDPTPPTIVLSLPPLRLEVLPYARFRANFSDADARAESDAAHAEAAALGRIHLFLSTTELGGYSHFHVLRATGERALPQVLPVHGRQLSDGELREAARLRDEFLRKAACCHRIVPRGWDFACPNGCGAQLRRVEHCVHLPNEHVLVVDSCPQCGFEAATSRSRLFDFSREELELFLPKVLVEKVLRDAQRPRARGIFR